MKRFKKELSWLLVAALVVSSLVIGFGQLQTSAAQASGQLGTFRVSARTNAQNCAGTGTDADFELVFTYDDSGTWYSGNFVPNGDMEESQTNTWIVSNVPVRPITSIGFRMMNYGNNDDWYWDWAKIEYCYDGTNYVEVGYNNGDGVANGTGYTIDFNYNGAIDTTYMRTLTWSGNGGTVNGSSTYTVYAVQGATYPNNSTNVPTSLSRTGYTFTGWSPAIPTVGPNANTTYTAQWSVNSYTITWNPGTNGTGGGTNSCNYGATPTPIAVTPNTGYTFTGWSPAVAECTGAATYTAQYSLNSYTITWNAGDGTGGGTTTVNHGVTPTPPTVTRTGYTFVAWTPTIVPATGNTTYTATWNQIYYTITWDAGGGTGGTTTSVAHGATPTPPTVTRTGYTFVAWTPNIVPATGNATYTATWNQIYYTITWDAGGGTGSTTTSVAHGATPTPPTVTKTGYTFVAWTPTIMPATGNATYTATWNQIYYTITWDAGGGTGGTTTSVAHGATPTPPTVTRTGYTFAAWTPTIVPATGNATYTATWSPNQYTISFTSNGGSTVSSITQNYGTQASAPSEPTKTGNTFAAWYSDAGLTNAVSWPYTITGDVTFYAKWTVNNYDITFDANGGTGGTGPTSMVYGSALSAPTVTRTGYTFSSWLPAVPSTVPAANTTYVAQWTINQYTVSFDSNGGSAVGSITQNYNTSVAEPAAPTKTGNTFAGWYSDAGLTTPVSWPFTLGAVNVTFYAKWTVNSYTIYFDEAGGSAVSDITQSYGTAVNAPAAPTKTGYTFLGWLPAVPAAMPASDTYCVAQWSIDSYTITWAANGGTGGGTNSCDYGATPTPIDAGTKDGYTFTGWDPAIVAATGDTTYTAQWSLNSYTITWAANGGTGGGTNSCDHGATPTPVDAGTKEGYTFTGWDPAIVAATGDTTYTAQWTINSYNLTFDANGGTGGTGPTATEYGAAISPPTVTRTGYTFTGWDPAVAATMPAADTTYTAQWTINSYNLTFDANGGTGGTGPTLTEYGAAISPPTVTRSFYTFAGWDPEVPATMPAADTVYTAQWTADPIELVPADLSTTVIDQTDMFIYGLYEGMAQADFESLFVEVLGNGRLEITTINGEFGTGTKIELINNVTEAVVATYYIVIFGDVNGDGYIGSIDSDLVLNFENSVIDWDPVTQPYLFRAGDLNGDSYAEAIDADIILNCENGYLWIDQTTGLAYAY